MKAGIIDRFRSLDIGGAAVVTGHVVASVACNLVATTVAMGLGLAVGFRPHASMLQWLATMAGMLVSSPKTANGATFIFMWRSGGVRPDRA